MKFIIKRVFISILIASSFSNVCIAQSADYVVPHNRFSCEGALSSLYTWRTEFSYHYMISKYIGVGTSFGSWKQYLEENPQPCGNNWWIDEDDEKLMNFYLCPSIHLETPSVNLGKNIRLSLFTEPGCQMNIPYERIYIGSNSNPQKNDYTYIHSKNPQWAFFNLKVGLCFRISYHAGVSLGYNFSTTDIYANRRTMRYANTSFDELYPQKKKMHEAFVSLVLYP